MAAYDRPVWRYRTNGNVDVWFSLLCGRPDQTQVVRTQEEVSGDPIPSESLHTCLCVRMCCRFASCVPAT